MAGTLSFEDVCDEVIGRAGGERATAEDLGTIRRNIPLLLDAWAADGYSTWRVEQKRLHAGGVARSSITLGEGVDDVISVLVDRGDGNEVPISRIHSSDYFSLTDKDTTGEPSQYWVKRSANPVLYIYPTGPADLIVWHVSRPTDFDRFDSGLGGIASRWLDALCWGLAHRLAATRDAKDHAFLQRLKGDYMESLGRAQRNDRERTSYKFRVKHGR